MDQYVGLDVSQEETHICVVDRDGNKLWEGSCASTPEGIDAAVIDDDNARHYRSIPVRISGSPVVLPNPKRVPDHMQNFIAEITSDNDMHPVQLAANAHYQLVTIHPFVDGNGRTARLLMNLILLQHGYPPALIRTRDRMKYILPLKKHSLTGQLPIIIR